MTDDRKRYVLAVTTLIGTIIGVGIFGVPYAISGIGLVPSLVYFAVLGGIQLLQHLYFAEAAIATKEKMRLPGLVEKHLGKRARGIAALSSICGFWAGQVAYIIIGGTFLHVLLSPYVGGEPFHFQQAWAFAGATIVFFGAAFILKVNFLATIGLLIAMLAILFLGTSKVRPDHFVFFANKDFLLPYGVILFSLSGLSAIPEMEDVLQGRHRHYRKAVVVGSLIATILTMAFGYVVWGVTGSATTEDAVAGLRIALGGNITTLTAVFGFLAVATSYFAFALNLQSTFRYDYRLHKVPAWLLSVGIPIGIFYAGAQSFISIVSFSGAVFGGITAIIVALLYIAVTRRKLVKEKPLKLPLSLAYVSIVVLGLGALYEMWTVVVK